MIVFSIKRHRKKDSFFPCPYRVRPGKGCRSGTGRAPAPSRPAAAASAAAPRSCTRSWKRPCRLSRLRLSSSSCPCRCCLLISKGWRFNEFSLGSVCPERVLVKSSFIAYIYKWLKKTAFLTAFHACGAEQRQHEVRPLRTEQRQPLYIRKRHSFVECFPYVSSRACPGKLTGFRIENGPKAGVFCYRQHHRRPHARRRAHHNHAPLRRQRRDQLRHRPAWTMDRVLLSLALSRVCPEPVLVKHWTNKITLVFLLLAPAADRLQCITCEKRHF